MKRAVLLLSSVALAVWGQSTNQSIQGLVTDTSGAVVPGARVTITNTATGVSMSATTNDTGNYTIQLIPVGDYDVRCEMPGFKGQTVHGQRIETAAQVRHNFVLEVGQVTETLQCVQHPVLWQSERHWIRDQRLDRSGWHPHGRSPRPAEPDAVVQFGLKLFF